MTEEQYNRARDLYIFIYALKANITDLDDYGRKHVEDGSVTKELNERHKDEVKADLLERLEQAVAKFKEL